MYELDHSLPAQVSGHESQLCVLRYPEPSGGAPMGNRQGICRLTGRSAYSDFCTFPEVEFSEEAVQSMATLGSLAI